MVLSLSALSRMKNSEVNDQMVSVEPDERLVRNFAIDDRPKEKSEIKRRWHWMLCRHFRDVEVDPEWRRYSQFAAWCKKQRYNDDYVLTHYLIAPGASEIGPQNALLVSPDVWYFIKPNGTYRPGDYRGASRSNATNRVWRATSHFRKETKLIGRYHTEEEAHFAWLQQKFEDGQIVLADIPAKDRALIKAFKAYLDKIEHCLDHRIEFTI